MKTAVHSPVYFQENMPFFLYNSMFTSAAVTRYARLAVAARPRRSAAISTEHASGKTLDETHTTNDTQCSRAFSQFTMRTG